MKERHQAMAQGREMPPRCPNLMRREADHRIKNSLQLVVSILEMQARQAAANAPLVEALAQASRRIHAVAQVHASLQHGGGRVELSAYLRELCADLAYSCAPESAAPFEFELAEMEMPGEQAVAVGLITTELIINALKHGRRYDGIDCIRVRLCTGPGTGFRLEVQDSGPGLPGDFDPDVGGGLGMRIISLLVRTLHGRLEVDRGPPGARFTLVLGPAEATRRVPAAPY